MNAAEAWLEAAWLHESDPEQLVQFATGHVSARKLRLFGCACGWKVAPFVTDIDPAELLEVAERVADNRHSPKEWREAEDRAGEYFFRAGMMRHHAGVIWSAVRWAATAGDAHFYWAAADTHPNHVRVALIREIFGNPFRPVDFAPWRTDTAVSLARQMYNSREFGAMPILADALQDAGCDNDEVLSHCRANAAHFRGCWVVDGVLGLE